MLDLRARPDALRVAVAVGFGRSAIFHPIAERGELAFDLR